MDVADAPSRRKGRRQKTGDGDSRMESFDEFLAERPGFSSFSIPA
jgi:hypothetical protein